MAFIKEDSAVGSRELAMSLANIKTIADAHAAGVVTLKGPVDITGTIIQPTAIETLDSVGEEEISPFSEKIDSSVFDGNSNQKNAAPIQPQAAVSQMGDVIQTNVETTSKPAENVSDQPTQEGIVVSQQPVNEQQKATPIQPQATVSQMGNGIQPNVETTTSKPVENIFDQPTQEGTVVSQQPLTGESQQTVSEQQKATPIQPEAAVSQMGNGIQTNVEATSKPAENIFDQPTQEGTVVSQQPPAGELQQPVNEQQNVAPIQPQAVVTETVKDSSETLVDNNIQKESLINSNVFGSPLLTKDIIAGVRITKDESLYDVSVRVGVSVDILSSLNNITDMNLKSGRFLLLPPGIKEVYRYEIEMFSDISKRIPGLLNNERKNQPEEELNGIGEGFTI